MGTVELLLPDQRTAFEPGESIGVTAGWMLEPGETEIEMRLAWHTSGKGGTDAEVANKWRFDNPALRESRVLEIVLPKSPYSFSGKLVSLSWTLELVAQPSGTFTQVDLIIAPGCREVILHASESDGEHLVPG